MAIDWTLSEEELDELIEEATMDCYDDQEAHEGFLATIYDRLECPFQAEVLGEEVKVTRLKYGGAGLVAVCRYKGKNHEIDLTSLTWLEPLPEGYKWFEAYICWRG